MVQSLLDHSITYKEQRGILQQDKKSQLSQYELNMHDIHILVAIGNQNFEYIDKGIIFFPIYAVNMDAEKEKVLYIGNFEVEAIYLNNYLDDDDDLDIEKIENPLLFSFVHKETLEKYSYGGNKNEEENDSDKDSVDKLTELVSKVAIKEEDDDDLEEDEDTEEDGDEEDEEQGREGKEDIYDNIGPKQPIVEELFEEDTKPITKEELVEHIQKMDEKEKQEMKKFETNDTKKPKSKNWVQTLFKNKSFNIVDNEGGGDCLFATIREAYKSIGKDISVSQLRVILASNATEEIFMHYKTLYMNFDITLNELKDQMKQLTSENNELKKQIKKTNKESEKTIIKENSKKIVNHYKTLKEDYEMYDKLIDEFRFMKHIDSLEDFKSILQTCEFWGETWAISTLERELNVKLILVSRESYNENDYDNIIQCGQLNDTILQDKGLFIPKHYIIVDWNGVHFRNITYNDKMMLSFEQIPMIIKRRIVQKCLSGEGMGPFGIIPKFQQLKQVIQSKEIEEIEYTGSPSLADNYTITSNILKKSLSSQDEEKSKKDEPIQLIPNDLYTNDVVFQFYEKSSDKKPGYGVGESITDDYEIIFAPLSIHKNWRKKLSNLFISPFQLDDAQWQTVDHYYIANQYKNNHPDIYKELSLDSSSILSKDPSLLRVFNVKYRESGKLGGEQIIPPNIKRDEDFDETKAQETIVKGLMAKFVQHKELNEILTLTYPAKLNYFMNGRNAVPAYALMEIRKELMG